MTTPRPSKPLTTAPKAPKAPSGLSTAGRALWKSVCDEYELDQHEVSLLLQACRVTDRLDAMAGALAAAPLTVINSKGDETAHPLLVESRLQALTLSRLLASLRLPSGDEDEQQRPQRRGAARGPYRLRSVL